MRKVGILILILIVSWSCEKSESTTTTSNNMGESGSLARFTIAGDHLYAVNGSRLKVFDLQFSPAANFVGEYDYRNNIRTIFKRDSLTLFLADLSGIKIIDLSIPGEPQLMGISHEGSSCFPMVADENHAYVSVRSSRKNRLCRGDKDKLAVLDISDPIRPIPDTSYAMASPTGLALYGDTLLLCDDGIKILDISDVHDVQEINHLKELEAQDIIARDSLIIVSARTGVYQYLYKQGELKLLSRI